MTEYEYALRTVTVASGQAFEIAHAVAPGTLVALCGTVAVPEPGSRWADSDPQSRCEACVRLIQGQDAGMPPAVDPGTPLLLAPVDGPGVVERMRDRVGAAVRAWRGLRRGARLGLGVAALLVVAVVIVLLSLGHGFHPDPTSAAYQNGYAYGHDLMGPSDDVAGSCTQATVDAPSSTAGKNFIAGCEAGYAARTP